MARVSVVFRNGELVNIDHAGYRYCRVDEREDRIEVSNDGHYWVILWPTPTPSCYDPDSDESFHEFDDHPSVCSACGESVDRSHEIDFMEDSD